MKARDVTLFQISVSFYACFRNPQYVHAFPSLFLPSFSVFCLVFAFFFCLETVGWLGFFNFAEGLFGLFFTFQSLREDAACLI